MLTKMVDIALNGTFLLTAVLTKSRNRVHSKRPAALEEDRLIAEWTEANRSRIALQAELDQATYCRLYSSQIKLLQMSKAAGDKCHDLIIRLRAHRKG